MQQLGSQLLLGLGRRAFACARGSTQDRRSKALTIAVTLRRFRTAEILYSGFWLASLAAIPSCSGSRVRRFARQRPVACHAPPQPVPVSCPPVCPDARHGSPAILVNPPSRPPRTAHPLAIPTATGLNPSTVLARASELKRKARGDNRGLRRGRFVQSQPDSHPRHSELPVGPIYQVKSRHGQGQTTMVASRTVEDNAPQERRIDDKPMVIGNVLT